MREQDAKNKYKPININLMCKQLALRKDKNPVLAFWKEAFVQNVSKDHENGKSILSSNKAQVLYYLIFLIHFYIFLCD